MRKLLACLAALALVATLLPALAWARPAPAASADSGRSQAATAELDRRLVELLAAGGDDPLTVFVHGASTGVAVAAAEAAGLTVVDVFDRVEVAVATGAPAAVAAVAGQPGVRYVEADAPISFGMQTSHIATRGAEARTAFQVPAGGDDGSAGGGNGGTEPGKGRGAERRPDHAGSGRPDHSKGRGPQGPGGGGSGAAKGGADAGGPGELIFADEIDGRGVSIAIVDSGIDGTHPMFQTGTGSKVVRNLKLLCHYLPACEGYGPGEPIEEVWLDMTGLGNDTDTPSLGGHGTHVAGTAAGVDVTTADGSELHGAAPGAHLIGLSIANAISIYGGAAGLNWVLAHHAEPCGAGVDPAECPPIRVVNNSWGPLGGGEYNPDSVISRLQELLVAEGVVVVWANGNDGGTGTDNRSNPPAQAPHGGVLGVANYSDGDTGTREGGLHATSSRGHEPRPTTYPDISAPGTNITSACRPQLAICNSLDADQDYGTISGTSMAAPHIAGIVAQLLQVRPELTPAEVEYVLEVTAHKFASGGPYVADPRNPDSTASFAAGHGLVDVVAAVAHVLDVTAPTAPAECAPDGPVVVDGKGDATSFAGFGTPLPSEPSLDVVEGRLDWDPATETLTFEIEVLDLAEANPPGTTGVAFDFFFTHAGVTYYLLAGRSDTDARGERFVLGRIETTRQTLVPDLAGSFDPERDTITIHLPNDRLGEVSGGVVVPPFAEGDVLGGFEIVSRRELGAGGAGFIPDADSAGGSCPYTIGLGAVPPPAGGGEEPGGEEPGGSGPPAEEQAPPGDEDHAVGPTPGDASWEGFTVSPTNGLVVGPEPCRQVVPDHGCAHTTRVFVTAAGTVTFAVSGMLPGDDWDVYVYDASGNQVGVGEEPGDESLTLTLAAGMYEVVVSPWLAPSGGYTATASWAP